MRDPLAEPRTTPVSLRRRPIPEDGTRGTTVPVAANALQCSVPGPGGIWQLHDESHSWKYSKRPECPVSVATCMSCGAIDFAELGDQIERLRRSKTPTLRGLIRAARAAGAPLRRYRADHIATEYWQCWDEGAHTRRAMVRHWPSDGMWRIEIYGRYDDPDGDHAVRVDLQNPSIQQIAAAARLCGWELDGAS